MDASKWIGSRDNETRSCWYSGFGICGGYQMLGKNLSDPYGVEEGGDTAGLGLLDVETIFAEKNALFR